MLSLRLAAVEKSLVAGAGSIAVLFVPELRHEIAIWQRAAASLSSYSRDEDSVRETLLKKARRLVQELQRKVTSGR